jgi:hypothetical protein
MLLARSLGSIGMRCLPFWYRTGEPVSRPGANAEDAERANRPSQGRARAVRLPPSGGCQTNRSYARHCMPLIPRLKPGRRPGRLAADRGGYPASGSLGLHPLRRTRCGGQAGPAPACLHRQPEAASIRQRHSAAHNELLPSAAVEQATKCRSDAASATPWVAGIAGSGWAGSFGIAAIGYPATAGLLPCQSGKDPTLSFPNPCSGGTFHGTTSCF